MADKEGIPEKIYFTTSRRAIEYIKWAGLDKKEPSDDIEYILDKKVGDSGGINDTEYIKELEREIVNLKLEIKDLEKGFQRGI